MDAASESRLQQVVPALSAIIHNLAELLAAENIELRVTQGLRSWGEQQSLYAQGRTKPGAIVTNAPPGSSWHNFGMAVDVAPFTADGQPDWNDGDPAWKRIIGLGESLGLVSGSTFVHCPDNPHFQLTGVFPVSPNDEVRQLFLDQGMSQVWDAARISVPTTAVDVDSEIAT